MKKILVIGGTQFIGRNLVEKLLEDKENDITLFNRGRTNPGLFPDIKKISGDRDTDDLKKTSGEHWDAVVDLSCYLPFQLERLLGVLKGKMKRYVFISTVSVYDLKKERTEPLNEEMEILPCSPEERNDPTIKGYGQKKAECERIIQNTAGLDAVILRPSIVYGKYDHTDRFYYWLYRILHREQILVPFSSHQLNITYIGDLCESIIKAIAIKKHNTVYNVATHDPLPLQKMISVIRTAAGTSPVLTETPKEILKEKGIHSSQDLPMWFQTDLCVSNLKTKAELEMNFMPFAETVKETIKHFSRAGWHRPTAGISLEKETDILKSLRHEN